MRIRTRAWKILVFMACLAVPVGVARAATLFVGSGSTNEVYRYHVDSTGTPSLETTLTANLDNPAFLAFSPWGELFVINRNIPWYQGGTSGSVARFLDPTGAATANGTIADDDADPGFNFWNPHGGEFRGSELFVVNPGNNNVLRFVFDASGKPSSNGVISDHLAGRNARGVGFNSAGDLFVTEANTSSLQLNQWTFDSLGNAVFAREFSGPGSNNHGIALAPWGEMFVIDGTAGLIARFLFDNTGAPVANGQITAPNALDLTFSPWGELFAGGAAVSRWTFDGSRNATANGSFSVPSNFAVGVRFAPLGPTTTTSTSTTTSSTSTSTTTSSTTTTLIVEQCGNCVDDDGDGLTDYEVPVCCTDGSALTVKKVSLKPGKGGLGVAKLKVKGSLVPTSFANVNPLSEDVTVQLRDPGGELVCTTLARSLWKGKGKGFTYKDKSGSQSHGLMKVAFKIKKTGPVRFQVASRNVNLARFTGPALLATVRAGDRCAGTFVVLRSKGKGLVYP